MILGVSAAWHLQAARVESNLGSVCAEFARSPCAVVLSAHRQYL